MPDKNKLKTWKDVLNQGGKAKTKRRLKKQQKLINRELVTNSTFNLAEYKMKKGKRIPK